MAMVKPRAVANPFTIPVRIPYSFCTLVIATPKTVQFVEMFLKKAMPSLYQALGVYLPLITRINTMVSRYSMCSGCKINL